jgi:hypothetical protein
MELGGWSLIADDFQACFYSTEPFHDGDVFVFNSFLWASALYIPATIPLPSASFVMQADPLAGTQPTLGVPNNMAVTSFVDGSPFSSSVGQQGWSIGMYHSEGGMVADPLGAALNQTPWVFLPDGSGESRICGQLIDCLASSEPQPYTQQFVVSNYNYRVIATQDIPPGSLLLSTGEVSNTGTASGSNPPTPSPTHPAPPSSAVGVGDVNASSPYAGFMSITSTTAPPDVTWVGKTIIIGLAAGPTSFTITGASLGDSDITFTPAPIPPVGGGPTYNAPFSLSL